MKIRVNSQRFSWKANLACPNSYGFHAQTGLYKESTSGRGLRPFSNYPEIVSVHIFTCTRK